jgi:hypothetical protein
MEKQLFTEVPLSERAEMLEANAEKVEEMTYAKSLPSEELEQARINYAQQAIEIATKQDTLKEITARLKDELKPMVEEHKDTLQVIKSKQKLVTEKVYHLADHEEGMMCTYNGQGELISSRRLLQEENQLSIHSKRSMRIAQNH